MTIGFTPVWTAAYCAPKGKEARHLRSAISAGIGVTVAQEARDE